jgi:hypothetical protein
MRGWAQGRIQTWIVVDPIGSHKISTNPAAGHQSPDNSPLPATWATYYRLVRNISSYFPLGRLSGEGDKPSPFAKPHKKQTLTTFEHREKVQP